MTFYQEMEKYDIEKMYKIYDQWPSLAQQSYDMDYEQAGFVGVDHIVFAGMGGSGTIGDVFASILSKNDIHVSVVKGYQLPKTVTKKSLVITTSVSGDTQETITILKNAHKMETQTIAFASGGNIEKYCKKNNIEFRKIERIHSPRASFTPFLFSMLKILGPIIPISKKNINESIVDMQKLALIISSNNLNETNLALDLAKWIKHTPMIYYPWGLQSAAIRFKNCLQENAKIHVMTEDVVEACHNGIVSWEKPSQIQPILIRGKDDHMKTKERWEIIKEYFTLKKIEYREVETNANSILSKLIYLIYLLDYASIYHAILTKTNPTPVKSIDFVKNRLNEL